MPSGITRNERFLLNGYHGQPTSGRVTIHVFDGAARLKRALGARGKWWGIITGRSMERAHPPNADGPPSGATREVTTEE